jgi:nucleoid-associated protein YgaU
MMRKDVKLGLLIGGVLLAVLVVYALVVPSGDSNSTSSTDNSGAQLVKPGKSDGKTAGGARDSVASKADATHSPDPFKDDTNAGPATAPSGALAKTDDKWNMALDHGELPTMMSQTPTPNNASSANTANASGAASDGVVKSGDSSTAHDSAKAVDSTKSGTGSAAASSGAADHSSGSASDTSSSGAKTHVVEKGETLASIASKYYGDANQWPHILKANPGLVANRIPPGTKLNIPDEASIKSDPKPFAARDEAPAAIDSKTQYRVGAGDSLYKISMKLYGNGSQVQKIYDLNRDTIGSDPAKLKLNMVLKLPEPPSVARAQ